MAKRKIRPSAGALGGSVTHLLHRALQLALDFHAESAGPGAITQRQFTVLAAAAAHDGSTQNDLVRATGIDRSTLADLVARMLAKGLLVRERSVTDARANSVRLSEAGRAALAAGAGPAGAADSRLLAFLSAKKRDSFLKTLAALAHAADQPAPANETSGKVAKAKPEKTAKSPAKTAKKQKKSKRAKAVAGV
ncbi:MAG TPA: MarR family transcriptional regulator [Caulobacteraceae bacterium]|jgi:DNA-binding MarR family transcriptional regulator|nr:MarR family transcriptional regulator [Caulobacteraceae bacterium]